MNLAIEGHLTRGAEVIEILEMLGGINVDNLYGDDTYYYYYITDDEEIDAVVSTYIDGDTCIFTLEEFLEKFPYKVGDKVQHKGATSCGSVYEIEQMKWEYDQVIYIICDLYWKNIKCTATTENLQPYKPYGEETMEEQKQIPPYMDYDIRTEENMEETIKIDIPKGYEFFGIDDDNKVVLTKKQFQYQKTYKECCDVLDCDKNLVLGTMPMKYKVLINLQKLLICRDAYWKIAGEQMGLSKPWKPYWTIYKHKFCLGTDKDKVIEECVTTGNRILAFPTKEMRDAFFDNFKDLIKACKELL